MTATTHRSRRSSAGFTMVELLVTIAIATILTTIAVPSFSGLIANQRAKTAASELFGSLLKARSDAIMLNANVTVSPLAGGWTQGWQILGPAAVVLESHGAVPGVTITPTGGAVTYRPSGRVTTTSTPSLLVTTTSGSTTNNQCISLNLSGRPSQQEAPAC
ncbi:MAG TPA: GspH/FimT family pseudopilin [Steroidobacteraceae bacterium]|nr:GspH/FimT family pseudopilin [Steroidobacteraceae bacterium]